MNWLVYDQGQEYVVSHANVIPAFKNIKVEPNDPWRALFWNMWRKVIRWSSPITGRPLGCIGCFDAKYLAGVIDRKDCD